MKNYRASHTAAAMLETRRRQLVETSENLGEHGAEHAHAWSEAIELAQAAAARSTSDALRHLIDEVRQDVEGALARLETGDYGVCEDCLQPIPLDRLRVLPEASRCVDCQRQHDDDPPIRACA